MPQWKNVDEFDGNSLKATDLKVGESVEGKVTAISKHKEYEAYFLYLDNEGEVTRLFTSGNLSYKVKDEKISVGNIYRITRLEDKPAQKKGAKPRSTFEVQIDEDTVKKALPAI